MNIFSRGRHGTDGGRDPAPGTPQPPVTPPPYARRPLLSRRPSLRVTAILATAMLAVGVGVGAAIGPAPTASFAGDTPALIAKLLSELASRNQSAASTSSTQAPVETPAETPSSSSSASSGATSTPAAAAETPAAGSQTSEPEATAPGKTKAPANSKVPAVTNVWLIQLSGPSYEELLAQKSAAPYISGQLIPTGTLLAGWSAIQGSALANEAALAAPSSAVSTPPIVHSIVQPPCPEGPAGEACSTPTGALHAADEFAQATLPQITGTAAFREHGLAVVTFATVGVASQQGLPAGASSATLTSQPPAGVLLISPFAKAGAHSSVAYQVSAPVHTLEALLH
jgi:hypothetical protein